MENEQQEIPQTAPETTPVTQEGAPTEPKRKRGRPPGSKTGKKAPAEGNPLAATPTDAPVKVKRKAAPEEAEDDGREPMGEDAARGFVQAAFDVEDELLKAGAWYLLRKELREKLAEKARQIATLKPAERAALEAPLTTEIAKIRLSPLEVIVLLHLCILSYKIVAILRLNASAKGINTDVEFTAAQKVYDHALAEASA